jgi:hypothetical protein
VSARQAKWLFCPQNSLALTNIQAVGHNFVMQAMDSALNEANWFLEFSSGLFQPYLGSWASRPFAALAAGALPHALLFRVLPTNYKAPTALMFGLLHIRWFVGPVAWLHTCLMASSYMLLALSLSPRARVTLGWLSVIASTYGVYIIEEMYPTLSAAARLSRFMAFVCGQRLVSLLYNTALFRGTMERKVITFKVQEFAGFPRESLHLPECLGKTAKFTKFQARDAVRRLALADAPPPTFIQYMAWMLHPGMALTGAFHEWADYHAALTGRVASTDTYYSVLAGNGARVTPLGVHGASSSGRLVSLRGSLWDACGALAYGLAGIISVALFFEMFSMHGYMLGVDERWNPWWQQLYVAFPGVVSWTLPGSVQEAWSVLRWIVSRGLSVWWERGLSVTAWLPACALMGRLLVYHWFVAEPMRYGWWHLGKAACILSGIGCVEALVAFGSSSCLHDPPCLQVYTFCTLFSPLGSVRSKILRKTLSRTASSEHTICRGAYNFMGPRPGDQHSDMNCLLLQTGHVSPSFCNLLLTNWSNVTSTDVFALYRTSEFRKLIRLWNPVSQTPGWLLLPVKIAYCPCDPLFAAHVLVA